MTRPRYLIVGGDSEIGAAAFAHMKACGDDVAATTRRPAMVTSERPLLDLESPTEDWVLPPGTPSACICAAAARLAHCAADPRGTWHLNVTRTLALAGRLTRMDVHTVLLSTNQVFDGSEPAIEPGAPLCPVSEYGRQKAAAEEALHRSMADGMPVAILRLTKVVGPRTALVSEWARELSAGRPVRAFGDMRLAPVPIPLVARAIRALMETRATGVYQLSGPRDVSYAELARWIAARLGADPALVVEVTAAHDGLPEGSTPRHTTMDSILLRERFGIEVPDAWTVIEPVLTAVRSGAGEVDEDAPGGAAAHDVQGRVDLIQGELVGDEAVEGQPTGLR